MNRNEMIIAINNIFDENMSLKSQNNVLETYYKESQMTKESSDKEIAKISLLDLKIIDYGKKQLVKDVLKSWGNEVEVWRDKESNEIVTTQYDEWLNKKIYESEIPDNMSKVEVMSAVHDCAIEIYEKEKIKSIKNFEEKELKNKEEKNED